MIKTYMFMSYYKKNDNLYVKIGLVTDNGVNQFPFSLLWTGGDIPAIGEMFQGDIDVDLRFSKNSVNGSNMFVVHSIKRVK